MLVQPGLCQTCLEIMLLVFSQGGSLVVLCIATICLWGDILVVDSQNWDQLVSLSINSTKSLVGDMTKHFVAGTLNHNTI